MRAGRLISIHVSQGGVPKRPVPEASIGPDGVSGDRQRDLRYHGGPERAVCLFSAEVIAALRAEGHPIAAGTTGENLTVAGVPWEAVVPGAGVRVGEVRLQVTSYAAPCSKIEGSFADGRSAHIAQKVNPGRSRVYVRVLQGGTVREGDPVQVTPPGPPAGV